MIRVLQVFASLNMGGAESRMMDVYRYIDRNEIQFDFLTMQLEEQYYEDEIRRLGGRVIKIAAPRDSGTLQNLKELTKIMREGKYDVVHAHTSYHCGMVMLAAKRAKIPVRISHSRTTGSKRQGKKTQLMLKLGRFLINRFATCRLAISWEAGIYLFGKKQFTVLPNAIDLRKYEQVDDAAIAALKAEFHIADSDIVFGQVGRFDVMKNHQFTIKIFSALYKKCPNTKLFLIGDGPLRKQCEEEAAKLDCADRIIFTGVRSDVCHWMHIFHKLLVPSLYEGLGGVILEGQAAGIPVFKSDSFTDAADLGLGLVSRCKLNDIEDWLTKLETSAERPEKSCIVQGFYDKGYSLDASISTLTGIYYGWYD